MKKAGLVLLLCAIGALHAEIRIVLTAALTDAYFEFRKNQYIESFTILRNYDYETFYIVEALRKKGPTFLDEYCSNVFYATVNKPHYINNGVNEVATFLEGLYHFNFDDEDMIIKITGRHQLTSDHLLRLVENNPDYDAFVKVNADGNVFTLGFAMKCKHFKEMFGRLNFDRLGKTMRPIEYDVGDYIKLKVKQGNFKVYYVDKLYMKANIFGSSTAPGAPEQIKYY